MSVRTAAVEGVGVWAPHLPGWDVARRVLGGEAAAPEAASPRPQPALLPANERRRAPDTVALALEVAAQACAAARRDAAALPSVFSSTHGDLAITDYMCRTLASDPATMSPTRFHNSVHNAAAGYWTIASGATAAYTALSAGSRSFAQGLLESLIQVECDGGPLLYVAYDVEACGPLATMVSSRGLLSVGLVLGPADSSHALVRLRWDIRAAEIPRETPIRSEHAALATDNAMHACLALLSALARAAPSRVTYSAGPRLALDIDVEPLAGSA